nr:hypothetical protein JVH1_0139 [Rhodococcus sp. JVH1]
MPVLNRTRMTLPAPRSNLCPYALHIFEGIDVRMPVDRPLGHRAE